ncbi:MAG: hypothetical protein IJS24_06600, partial [Eubacterium sp.]|nr:hypothetical protein [Eubacterium sp.]
LKLASTNTSTVRLKATIGGVFAGYVYMDKYDTSVYPDECEINGEIWRARFSTPAAYIGVIGDKVKFATGATSYVSESNINVEKPAKNSVTPYYHVDAKSQIFDLRVCVQAGAK